MNAFLRQAFPAGQQPAAIGPRGVDLAAPAALLLPDHPAADVGHRVVGQLHDVEVIHDQPGIGQQPWGGDRLGIDRGRVDGHEPDRLPERRTALAQPVHDGHAGPAGGLTEQALIAGQVDETGVVGIDSGPPSGQLVVDPTWPPAPGLIDA